VGYRYGGVSFIRWDGDRLRQVGGAYVSCDVGILHVTGRVDLDSSREDG